MLDDQKLRSAILKVSPANFEALALEVYRYQLANNRLYAEFVSLLGKKDKKITQLSEIPCLPVGFFKNYQIQTGQWTAQQIYTSSGTTGETTSSHFVRKTSWYYQIAQQLFEEQYGPLSEFCVLALLPAYLERQGSSLVDMARHFIACTNDKDSGFFLYNTDTLLEVIKKKQDEGKPILLLGVSFALWDLAEQTPGFLKDVIVMETGGMKGRRREITRKELHRILTKGLGVERIHSEYGMTELLSQVYSKGDGLFKASGTVRVLNREITDPFAMPPIGKTGAMNIIDLANIDSCSFIATDDLGRIYEDGTFEILGRMDNSDIRGCNLLVGL